MTSDAEPGAIIETRAYDDAVGRKRLSLATRSDVTVQAQVSSLGGTWLDPQLLAKDSALRSDGAASHAICGGKPCVGLRPLASSRRRSCGDSRLRSRSCAWARRLQRLCTVQRRTGASTQRRQCSFQVRRTPDYDESGRLQFAFDWSSSSARLASPSRPAS
jgi:hypothetical protein